MHTDENKSRKTKGSPSTLRSAPGNFTKIFNAEDAEVGAEERG